MISIDIDSLYIYMKSFTLARKTYETPEAEAFVVLLENFCDSIGGDNKINPMDEPEDL